MQVAVNLVVVREANKNPVEVRILIKVKNLELMKRKKDTLDYYRQS